MSTELGTIDIPVRVDASVVVRVLAAYLEVANPSALLRRVAAAATVNAATLATPEGRALLAFSDRMEAVADEEQVREDGGPGADW
jgi:hypothetical protein